MTIDGAPQACVAVVISERFAGGELQDQLRRLTNIFQIFLASSCIEKRPRWLDGLQEVRIADGPRHDQIDGPADEHGERFA